MKRILLLSFVLLGLISSAWAQRAVTGKVTDASSGEALPGVAIRVKNTSQGTVTDIDGNYRLEVPSNNSVLVYSFIGYTDREVTVGNQSVINVQLAENVDQLEEVVVIGYGEVDKRKLISSVSSVSGEAIAKQPVTSFDQGLAGRASGVQVTVPSGVLGQAPRIRIRGTNSITSGTEPLIVVDGVPMIQGNQSAVTPTNPLGDINPNDIESFQVLKDGAATAIYGSRAANGVILITTKRGKIGDARVTYNGYVGVNRVASRFDVLNADEFIRISNEKFATAGITTPQALPGPNNEDTDWQDVIFRNGLAQSHDLSISGGSAKARYFISAGYLDQEGAIVRNSLNRTTIRGNVDYQGVKWLDLGLKVALSRQVTNGLNTGTNALSGNVTSATRLFPNVAVYNPDDPTGYNINASRRAIGRGNNLLDIASNYTNVQYTLDKNIFESTNLRTLTNVYAQINLLEGLKLRTQYGIDLLDVQDFQSWDPFHGDGVGSNGYVYRGNYQLFRWNWQNTLSYYKTIATNHSIGVVVGSEYQKTTTDEFFGQGTDFSDAFFIRNGLISGTFGTQESGGGYVQRGFDSYFARLNYDYDDRYLLSISARNDAISDLPIDTRQGTFWGAALGWNIANESFFDFGVLEDLKLRGSYAETGNVNIGAFSYLGTYGPELYGGQTAIRFENVGNSNLRWEKSTKWSAGVDFGLFNNRLTGSFDWYRNDVDDLILDAPTPPSFGIPGNSIAQNVGALVNEGIELSLNSINMKSGSFSWSTNFTLTTNRNEITALNNDADIQFTYTINRVGESISSLYGFRYAGVNSANGNPLYYKADGTIIQGNPDDNRYYVYDPANPAVLSETATLAQSDRTILGQSNPTFFGGLGNSFTFGGFDLDVFLTYSGGNKIYNATLQEGLGQEFLNNNAKILDRWTPLNTNTDVPRLSYNNSNFLNLSGQATSRFVEDGDFIRVQNITLGYTVPENAFQAIGMNSVQRLRVYAQVQNAFVFTNYSGLDPELNTSNTTNSAFGVDYNTNPLLRTFTVGLSLGL